MTATKELLRKLRKMLNGCRRTETAGFDTYWITADALDSSLDELENAIATTLEQAERTCHIVKASRKYVLSDGTELFEDGCSVCNGYLGDGDNYCPSCGAKVVSDER